MYRGHTIGVVIPAYNEEEFVGGVVRDIPDFVDAIFLVDDASTDETWRAMAEAMYARGSNGSQPATPTGSLAGDSRLDNRIAVAETVGTVTRLRHRENRGAGGAIKTGYLAALEAGVDVIATIDGDGQMNGARMPAILDPIVTGQAGYAKGDRFAKRELARPMPPFRLFGNLLLTGLTRIASGYWRLSDPQNGFTAISRSALLAVDVEGLWEYYGYMNQLLAQLNVAGIRVADVPVPATYGDEESSIRYLEYIRRVSVLLLASFLYRLRTRVVDRDNSPVLAGYVVGPLIGIAGVLTKLVVAVTGRESISWREVVSALIIGVTTFTAAVGVDRATEPIVVEEGGKARASDAPERTEVTNDPR